MGKQGRDRRSDSFKRGSASRPTGDIILIVCEGNKTEPQYFKSLQAEWKISAAQVEICGEQCGSAPISVVDHAIEARKTREREFKRTGTPKYDQVWCVFDVDRHVSLQDAQKKAKDNKLKVALSTPCFEFWYLLHFLYTTRPFPRCEDVVSELKKHIPDYRKNAAPITLLLENLDNALANARRLRADNDKTGSTNPATDVDKLAQILQSLKRS